MERKNLREFHCIREVIQHIYQYGFYTREDFVAQKIVGSFRAYDDIIRQLRDLYFLDAGEAAPVLEEDTRGRGKYKCYRFRRDYFGSTGGALTAAFGLFSARKNAVEQILCCLSLAAAPCGADLTGVADGCGDAEGTDYRPTIHRRLCALVRDGYLSREKNRYRLNAGLTDLPDTALVQLYYLASFYAGAGYPRAVAAFLQKALLRQFAFRGLPKPAEAFLFRDSAGGNVFDEQVVHQLLQCCRDHTEAELTMTRREKAPAVVRPVALKPDTRLGRWYLLAVQEGSPRMIRVSHIRKVRRLSGTFDYAQARAQVEAVFSHGHLSGKTADTLVRVEAELRFEGSPLRRQFERELLVGRIEERNGREYYCAEVRDPVELKPLLRCYGACLNILPSEGHRLNQELLEEYERMLEQYGAL